MTRMLTDREREVARLICFGLTEKEISRHLGISPHTVNSHKKNLFNKTGCRNIADVTRWYIQEAFGIRIEPQSPIQNLASSLFTALVLVRERFSSALYKARGRVRSTAAQIFGPATRALCHQPFYLQST